MKLDDLLRYKALHFKYVSDNPVLMDMIAADEIPNGVQLKNVCAMVSQQLFDELTNVCGLLDISKRAFIEAALIEALNRAAQVLDDEGIENILNRFAVEA